MTGCLFPITISKQNEVFENDTTLQFFLASSLEKQQQDQGKSNFLMQRYVITRGLGCNVIRVILQRDPAQSLKNAKLTVFRIGSKIRYDAENAKKKEEFLNLKTLNSMIEKGGNLKQIKRYV